MYIYSVGGVKPADLQCETTTNSIKVSWTQPNPLGVVKQYYVKRNGAGAEAETTTQDKFFTFNNLEIYTPYQITVTTENEPFDLTHGGGKGDPATIDCKTDPKGKSVL